MSTEGVTLVTRRTVRASQERVFAAWTSPEQLKQWWGPRGVACVGAEVDLRVGGCYRLGNQLPDGRVIWIVGTFELIEAPSKLVYSWRIEPAASTQERVTVHFQSKNGATEVIVVHENIASTALRDEHAQGWDGCLDGLVDLFVEQA